MVQVVKQTKEEKIAMYMKCPKKHLAEMLWACNELIENITPIVTVRQIKNHGNPNFRSTGR